jgi:hypothetical protein
VASGQTKSVRNVKLSAGGTLAGRVTNQVGEPLGGAWVSIDSGWPGRAGPGEGRYTAQTDDDGRYTIHGAPLGDHKVFVYDYASDYAPEWSGDADTAARATPVRIRAGKTTSFDAELGPAAHISGEVLTSAGEAVTDYFVGQIFASDGSYIGDFDVYNGNTFTSSSLPGGSFTLSLTNADSGKTYWYDSGTTQAEATPVTLARGQEAHITVHLP